MFYASGHVPSRKYLSGALKNFLSSRGGRPHYSRHRNSWDYIYIESLSRRVLMITFAARLSRTLNNIFIIYLWLLAPACTMKASRQRNNASRVCTRVQRSCTHTLTHSPSLHLPARSLCIFLSRPLSVMRVLGSFFFAPAPSIEIPAADGGGFCRRSSRSSSDALLV